MIVYGNAKFNILCLEILIIIKQFNIHVYIHKKTYVIVEMFCNLKTNNINENMLLLKYFNFPKLVLTLDVKSD